ncbi:MAG: hypothetical protein OEV21_00370 [Thermoplasmata archaeon]|nr:hypothetical protein [Thermoplasmata archaeon]
MKLRINLLCIVGSLIGIIAIFLPWQVHTYEFDDVFHQSTMDLLDFLPFYIVLIGVYLIACIASFVSPVGGIPMLISTFMLQQNVISDWFPRSGGGPGNSFALGIGVYLAFIASFIVILSYFAPIGKRMNIGLSNLRHRLLTISRIDRELKGE